MSLNEFDIINNYFRRELPESNEVLVGIGDDAAVLRKNSKEDLIVSIDTLVAGVHFPLNTSPYDIAWKSLAVNLSDMAAMGAQPAWFTLALTLPEPSSHWLEAFTHGLFSLADQYSLPLIGGDTTRGPLSITIQIAGNVSKDSALLRSGAQVGDDIFVSGTLGDAALALAMMQSAESPVQIAPELLARLNRPEPRVNLGKSLSGIAHCCIDISDGLLADLKHMLDQANVGAEIETEILPKSPAYRRTSGLSENNLHLQLNGGDDYELCFCAPVEKKELIIALATECDLPLTRIGNVTASQLIVDSNGCEIIQDHMGYQHFNNNTI